MLRNKLVPNIQTKLLQYYASKLPYLFTQTKICEFRIISLILQLKLTRQNINFYASHVLNLPQFFYVFIFLSVPKQVSNLNDFNTKLNWSDSAEILDLYVQYDSLLIGTKKKKIRTKNVSVRLHQRKIIFEHFFAQQTVEFGMCSQGII